MSRIPAGRHNPDLLDFANSLIRNSYDCVLMERNLTGEWTLTAGEEVLGVIGDGRPDMPWFEGSWTPTQAFEQFAPLFESELALMDVMDTDFERWEAVYMEIRSAVDLRFPNGDLVPEFVLHIDDSRAWFRWHDDTFKN